MSPRPRWTRTRRGFRVVEGGDVVSELLAEPGATHSIFDVMAAAIAVLAPDSPLLMLGFAAGGVVAPLRALGYRAPIEAVDISRRDLALFRSVSRGWGGEVRFTRADAAERLERSREKFGAILEDLSVNGEDGATKPPVSVDRLPGLIRRRLAPGGVAVINAIPVAGTSWSELLSRLTEPFEDSRVVTFDEYENRIVIASRRLEPAVSLSRRLRTALRSIRSRQSARIAIRRRAGS